MGKVLFVDLTNETFEEQEIPDEVYKQYLGGYGLACKLIYENTKANYDPLGSEAILGFFPGLLSGTPAPLSGRYMVCGKSPLTGSWGDANSGGTFSPAIKKCGYDGILFKGIAKKPVYLSIIDGKKEILDASDIWGLDIIEAEEKLKEKHGNFIKTAGIGQAGENLSLIAGIANDKGRLAARCGLGAVMGSKKLKMLVLKGKEKVSILKKTIYLDHVKKYNKKEEKPSKLMKPLAKIAPKMGKMLRFTGISFDTAPISLMRTIYQKFGTSSSNVISIETGDSPIKNWTGIGHKDFPSSLSKSINAPEILKYVEKPYGCITCPVKCGAICKVPELNLEETHRPEYETCAAFGSNLLNNDLVSIFELNELTNRAAIDCISTGAVVAFAMECFENGILTEKDIGFPLVWGDKEAIVKLTKMIINREGIGDVLADGVKRAAEKIGKGSEEYAIHTLGQELPMHNPRVFNSLAYTYTFDPTPGKHTVPSLDFHEVGPVNKMIPEIKMPKKYKKDDLMRAEGQKVTTCVHSATSSAGLCMFALFYGKYPFFELLNSLTDWALKPSEILENGHRIQTLRQSFALREGVKLAENRLTGRVIGDPPFEKGPTKGVTIDDYVDRYKRYCTAMGWNPDDGRPLEKTLKELNLDFVIKDLY